MAKRNAEIVLQYTTVYPFRLRGKWMECVYCREQYEDPAEYRQHMSDIHQSFTLSTAFAHCAKRTDLLKVDCTHIECRICSQKLDSLNEAAKHLYTDHNKKINLDCDIGMQPYKIDKDNWTCYLCNLRFAALTKLCRHTTSHYQRYTCDICGRSYLTNEALKYHVKCAHSGKYECRKCWKEFESVEMKREHVKESKSCWSFCCTTCGERFCSWENKQKHLVEVHNVPKRTYECPECARVYESRKLFYKHYKLTHTEESLVCAFCGLKFICRNQLEDHRLGHTTEKQFKCNICLKSFSRDKSLKAHLWIHSETKRFSCIICDKQFAQKVSLKGHMKSHHPGVSFEL